MQRQSHGRAGFSLVELLVASAIFLVLLGGIAALYSNALRTVLFGYQAQGAFEKVRASLSVLERDLAGAFSARPYGDRYNFFGTGQGFTFVGRLDAVGHVGMDLVRQIRTIYDHYDYPTQIIVAAVRHPVHVLEAALAGADVCTMFFDVMKQLYDHPLTDVGIEMFLNDWRKVPQDAEP